MPNCINYETVRDSAAYFIGKFEAEPIVHGRWIEHEENICYLIECSRCHTKVHICYLDEGCTIYHNPPYCPNCGAKMDEEASDDEVYRRKHKS